MSLTSRLASTLLLTSALASPALVWAQDTPPAIQPPSGETVAESPTEELAEEEKVDISVPGGEILVTGARDRNIAKNSDQVVFVLSGAEIARTGEGNIAGALGRVTGLSVVGSGFVYIRGLGDRYSLALLNGLPLPSPEPLRRVVPLDLFPSGVIASSLVQKSYSANYPGEFGGGVINLTTKAVPNETFVTFGGGISGDSETTGQLGYTYYGSGSDWTGFDNGERHVPPALQAYFDSGEQISSGNVDTQAIASQLVTGRNAVVQRWRNIPPNVSGSVTAGGSVDLGWGEFGVILNAGYSNKWQTKDAIAQTSANNDLSLESDFRRVTTDQRIVGNGLLGFGLEFGEHQIRWTNLFIHDTIKHTRLGAGTRAASSFDFVQQNTAWYERQLFETQLVGEFELTEALSLDVRGAFANSRRDAPSELFFEYARTNSPTSPTGALFINTLDNNTGTASVVFSDLDEDLWAGGIDLTYLVGANLSATVGAVYTDTQRTGTRRSFTFGAPGGFPTGVGVLRPDLLLQPAVVDAFDITLFENDPALPSYFARLENFAGYAKANWQLTDTVSLDAGVRYEKALQTVRPVEVFNVPTAADAFTSLDNAYWLPGATLTWQFRPDMQFRLSASKTIARPQFRELIFQPYFDPESNRVYLGNPLLEDSQLYNGEARVEWYFAPDQRLSLSGFYKRIDNPIESFLVPGFTRFANAPRATLYGGEVEAQKYFDVTGWGGAFTDRRIVAIGNYTCSKSELKLGANDAVNVFGITSTTDPLDFFRNGAPLTGQSDHLVNLQLGLEHNERLSQQTFLLTYASDRVISRGLVSINQADVVERPGIRLDFVAREGFMLFGAEFEGKVEVRNIFGQGHEEFQQAGAARVDVNTYDVGRSFSFSASLKF